MVMVTADGQPLAGARVVVHYPNKTWMEATSDTFGRTEFGFHTDLPIAVYCAAPGHTGHVEHGWQPPAPLSIELRRMQEGGSNVAIEEGRQQPVHFKLGQPLRLTDVQGREWTVRFIDLFGKSSLLEYAPPPPPARPG